MYYTEMTQDERILYADLFSRYGNLTDCADKKLCFYGRRPDTIETPERIASADKSAADFLQQLDKLQRAIQLYRMELTGRYNELMTAPYKPGIRLQRERHYHDNHTKYRLTWFQRYIDTGEEVTMQDKVFPGTERQNAIKLFECVIKEHPDYIAIKDIERKSWER